MKVQKTIKGVVREVDLQTTALSKIKDWLSDSCDTETPLSLQAIEALEKRVAIKGLHWEKHSYLLYWAMVFLSYLGLFAGTYFTLKPGAFEKLVYQEVLSMMVVYLFVSLIIGGVLYVITYLTLGLDGAAAIRNSLHPISSQKDSYYIGSSYCDEALKYVTQHNFCKVYRDKVISEGRELRYFDMQVMRSMVFKHRIADNEAKHQQTCKELHGVA